MSALFFAGGVRAVRPPLVGRRFLFSGVPIPKLEGKVNPEEGNGNSSKATCQGNLKSTEAMRVKLEGKVNPEEGNGKPTSQVIGNGKSTEAMKMKRSEVNGSPTPPGNGNGIGGNGEAIRPPQGYVSIFGIPVPIPVIDPNITLGTAIGTTIYALRSSWPVVSGWYDKGMKRWKFKSNAIVLLQDDNNIVWKIPNIPMGTIRKDLSMRVDDDNILHLLVRKPDEENEENRLVLKEKMILPPLGEYRHANVKITVEIDELNDVAYVKVTGFQRKAFDVDV